jgi:peptidoglycan biosynthesis protein MviN/MurJ (putative lipid II flippase)
MFEIQPMNAEAYRQQTRRSAVMIALIFLALAMALSTLAVAVFGEPGGDNLRFNIGGVFAAVLVMAALMRARCSGPGHGWRQRSTAGNSSAA